MNKSDLSSLDFQRERYELEAKEYNKHHGDEISQLYRDIFIRRHIFPDTDLSNKIVLDAMCASGIETGYLLKKGAEVLGLDISNENALIYKQNWQRECVVQSIHQTLFPDNNFDIVYICGGIHHVLPLLDETMAEVHRILKPGGYFCFVEPNYDTWLNLIRKLWYRLDKRFHESESAISYKNKLLPYLDLGFQEDTVVYGGNLAYLFIEQSLIIRIPYKVKKLIYKSFFSLEKFFNKIPGIPKLFFAARWKKN